jgi:ATP-binding cassette subfamily B protein/ATP-binding cassette subfamily C protein
MDEIYSAADNKTLIIIAHRLSTVELCDRRIVITDGKITNSPVSVRAARRRKK